MSRDHLFAGLRVLESSEARQWDARLLGEAVVLPACRGKRLTYSNGVRKAVYHDPDGNELSFAGAPVEAG